MEKCRARKCPICENEYVEVIKEIHMMLPEYFRLPSSYQVVSCTECGFVYADTTATKEDYDHYYENCNYYGTMPEVELDRFELVKEFLVDKDKASKILDIGAGDGKLLHDLRKNGFLNSIGLDPSMPSICIMKEKGIEAVCSSIYDIPIQKLEGKFDIVFLMNVVEHLFYPKKSLENAKKYLKEDGILVIEVPDYSKLSLVGTPIPDQFNQEHINYFSEISLENLLKEIELEKVFTKNFIHYTNDLPQPFLIMSFKNNRSDNQLLLDNLTRESIKKYFKKQFNKVEALNQKLKECLESQNPVVVWGTGAYTMNLLSTTTLGQCNIISFIDNNMSKVGNKFFQRCIESPEILKPNQTKPTIVICSMLFSKQIVDQIKNDLQLDNEVIVL